MIQPATMDARQQGQCAIANESNWNSPRLQPASRTATAANSPMRIPSGSAVEDEVHHCVRAGGRNARARPRPANRASSRGKSSQLKHAANDQKHERHSQQQQRYAAFDEKLNVVVVNKEPGGVLFKRRSKARIEQRKAEHADPERVLRKHCQRRRESTRPGRTIRRRIRSHRSPFVNRDATGQEAEPNDLPERSSDATPAA